MIKKLIQWARITAAGGDDKQFPVQQIEHKGKVSDCFIVFPYGIHGNVSVDALALLFSVGGDTSNKAAIAGTPKNRPKMAAGENCIYHPPTGTIIHFRQSGDIDITSETNLNINAPDVNIIGNLTVTGDTALGANVTSNGKDISDTHTHAGSPTAPTGGISPTGTPV